METNKMGFINVEAVPAHINGVFFNRAQTSENKLIYLYNA
jgi:hypothetical protein